MNQRNPFRSNIIITILSLFAIAWSTSQVAQAQVVTPVHTFNTTRDGANPDTKLAVYTDGSLYGETYYGGVAGVGTVFKIATNGTFSTIHNFIGTDGSDPTGSLLLYSDGNFYGTTEYGGTDNAGTVFKMTPAGVVTTIYNFGTNSATDGVYPLDGLTLGPDGNFWGTTYEGGKNSVGAIFKMTTLGGGKSVVYSFNTTSGGYYPISNLVSDGVGTLYGTATNGGATSSGVFFKISTTGTFNQVKQFNGTNGTNPQGTLILASDGNYYGTTVSGGANGYGTVFKLTTSTSALTALYSFKAGTDGSTPYGGVIQGTDGNFYGTTSVGGTGGSGVVFQLTSAGVLTPLKSFTAGTDGATPELGLVQGQNGNLYGCTYYGGGTRNLGTIFTLSTTGSGYSIVYNFSNGFVDGTTPQARLLLASDGNYYGTTYYGGVNGVGTIYQITPTGTYSVLYSFTNGLDGAYPEGGLIQGPDGTFYGTAYAGGSGYGTVYKFTVSGSPSTIALTPLYAFDSTHGAYPYGELLLYSDGNLYGTTTQGGGSFNGGTVYQLTTGGGFSLIKSFTGANGFNPQSGLIVGPDGNMWGTTVSGGSHNNGEVYEITSGGALTIVKSLNSASSGPYSPYGSLALSAGGTVFGTAYSGGTGGYGAVFQIISGTFSTLYNFNSATGANPQSGVTIGSDGNLYGTTYYGGTNNLGTLYKLTTSGTESVLYNWDETIGYYPTTALIQGSDGNFYGTIAYGGAGYTAVGSVYKLDVDIPTISGFTPTSGKIGDTITINGTNFTTATSVSINGQAASFAVVNDTQITATVPANCTLTGNITVTTPAQTASLGTFTFIPPAVISNFTPTSGKTGDTITINGSGFTGATSVEFNLVGATSFAVVNDGQITAVVPATASTGPITVVAPGGSGQSSTPFTFYPTPTISSIAPTSGKTGDSIVITGTNFANVTSVAFNGVNAAGYTVNSATQITATVPATATTGSITVTTLGGTATSGTFTFLPAPTITSFTPTSGGKGVTVQITGTNFTGVTAVTFNGTSATNTVVNSTTINTTVPSGATTGPISVTASGGAVISSTNFTVVDTTIKSFAPTSGCAGSLVLISGTDFTVANGVSFHGTPAASFAIVGTSSIIAVVPNGATTGDITVSVPGGVATSATAYTVTAVAAPTVSSISPPTGPVGTTVLINGTNLQGIESVTFNGVAASWADVNGTRIAATVPVGATTGNVVVTTSDGTASSSFTVNGAPTVTTFSPTSGAAGTLVTITGTHLTGTSVVLFNGVPAQYIVEAQSTIVALVPPTATTGTITVKTPAGSVSTATFTVP